MPEAISNCVTPANYLGDAWIEQSYDCPEESAASLTIRPSSDRRIYGQQTFCGAKAEVSEVVTSVPSAGMREHAKTLESDLTTFREHQSEVWSATATFFESLQTENADISVRRTLVPGVYSRGVSRVRELMSPANSFGEWLTDVLVLNVPKDGTIHVQSRGRSLLEYASAPVIAQIREWGIQDQVNKALAVIPNTYRTLRETVLNISEDPEIPDRQRLRVTLTVSGTPEEVFEDELRFRDWVCSELDTKAGELITITYEWE